MHAQITGHQTDPEFSLRIGMIHPLAGWSRHPGNNPPESASFPKQVIVGFLPEIIEYEQ